MICLLNPNQPVSSFSITSHTFVGFLPRIIRYDGVNYQENFRSIMMLTLELPHQSKWLVLEFHKCANPHLGIMVLDGLVIPKMYWITWNSFCKKVINQ